MGRIQLIRLSKDVAGNHKFKRLDMSKTAIREKVANAINTDELDHIFDTDGIIEIRRNSNMANELQPLSLLFQNRLFWIT